MTTTPSNEQSLEGLVERDRNATEYETVLNSYADENQRLHDRVEAAEQQVRDMSGQVEQAFRDGLSYGGNVENADPDIAWQHYRARLLLKDGGK